MPYLVIGLLIIGAVIYSVLIKPKRQDPLDKLASWPYEKKQQLLNPLELTFYQALLLHLQPGLAVLPKVRLGDLVYVADNARGAGLLRGKLAQYSRSLDFLICESATLKPVCAVLFDDQVEEKISAEDSAFLAKMLAAANLPLFRYQPQYEYAAADFQPINLLFISGDF
jgi:hypothetical protein